MGQRVVATPADLVNRFGIVLAVPVAPDGRPSASPAAMGALSEEVSLAAETVTSGRESHLTVHAMRAAPRARPMPRRGNLRADPHAEYLRRGSERSHGAPPTARTGPKGQGQRDRRTLEVSPDWLPYPDVQQVFRVTHRSNPTQTAEMHYGCTSLPPAHALVCRPQTLHRGTGQPRTRTISSGT